ncbi:hypothetical protein ACJX0J_012514, partial [Zea mays]
VHTRLEEITHILEGVYLPTSHYVRIVMASQQYKGRDLCIAPPLYNNFTQEIELFNNQYLDNDIRHYLMIDKILPFFL